eukprot:CAMPEP_0202879520 /NCGR_PEP_ID=MMETSP1391-20130828/33730_1 /ASSEMBLY_ACC=CAM_ASM_000867 /TAXON_ID=1034604 /ORGANISM="Chlamydomonas leiostraca, Strain SAG 11-49" /LENGTH=77 /DNA_ID=CAMNT_0049561885 /DNA_START=168 /DNA_END=401 /DNA_ORIENTATION=+
MQFNIQAPVLQHASSSAQHECPQMSAAVHVLLEDGCSAGCVGAPASSAAAGTIPLPTLVAPMTSVPVPDPVPCTPAP